MKPYNELVKSYKFIEFDDLCELVGVKNGLRSFCFPVEHGNDTFVPIHCDDYSLEQLYDDLDTNDDSSYMSDYYGKNWHERYENEIKLIEILRHAYGIRDTVLTYISW